MKKLLLLLTISLILSACEKEVIEKQPEQPKVVYHNIKVSFDEKKWYSYVLEEKETLVFKNTGKDEYWRKYHIFVKDEKTVVKDTFPLNKERKVFYYNGLIKIKE